MIRKTLKFWSLTREALLETESARRLAAGVALGMAIGLIPKDSLLVYFLICLLMMTTANLLCATLSALFFNWIGHFLDPLTHQLGSMILTHHQLEPMWVWLYSLPVIPWTRMNNTVVMGNLLLALFLLYPSYAISCGVFHRYGVAFHAALARTFWYRWLIAPNSSRELTGAS